MSLDDLKNIKNELPYLSPVLPVELSLDSEIQSQFSSKFLKQVWFGEMSIPAHADTCERQLSKRAQRVRTS